MKYSTHGALMQAFVVDRLLQTCDLILSNKDEVRAQMEASGMASIINPDAWIGCAEELKTALS